MNQPYGPMRICSYVIRRCNKTIDYKHMQADVPCYLPRNNVSISSPSSNG